MSVNTDFSKLINNKNNIINYDNIVSEIKKNENYNNNKDNDNDTENNIDKYNKFIENIIKIFEIKEYKSIKIIKDLSKKLSNNNKLKLLDNLNEKTNKLLDEDVKLLKFKYTLKKHIKFEQIENNWNKLMIQIGKLQALILIRKLNNNNNININDLINTINEGFDNKFNMLNTILEENIGLQNQQGGSNNILNYLDYKIKYISSK